MRIPKFIWSATVILCMSSLLVGPRPATAELVIWFSIEGIGHPKAEVAAIKGSDLPWLTTGGRVQVNLVNGDVSFRVTGLALAGGDDIGRTPVVEVMGTLVCDANGDAGGPVVMDTATTSLSADGKADFQGTVSIDPVCSAESPPDVAFLIRTSSGEPAPSCQGSDDFCWLAHGAELRN